MAYGFVFISNLQYVCKFQGVVLTKVHLGQHLIKLAPNLAQSGRIGFSPQNLRINTQCIKVTNQSGIRLHAMLAANLDSD